MHYKNFNDYLRAVRGKVEPVNAIEFDLKEVKDESKAEQSDSVSDISELPSEE